MFVVFSFRVGLFVSVWSECWFAYVVCLYVSFKPMRQFSKPVPINFLKSPQLYSDNLELETESSCESL